MNCAHFYLIFSVNKLYMFKETRNETCYDKLCVLFVIQYLHYTFNLEVLNIPIIATVDSWFFSSFHFTLNTSRER